MADGANSTLTSFSLTQAVDALSNPVLTITANASDPDGVGSVQLNFGSPLLSVTNRHGYRDAPIIWAEGDWNGGARSARFTIDRINEPGPHTLRSVLVVDAKGNVTEFTAENLRAAGFDTGFMLSGVTPDNEAPILRSLNIPARIDTSKGPVPWKITAQATDAMLPLEAQVLIEFDRPIKGAWYQSAFIKPAISSYYDYASFSLYGADLATGKAASTWWVAAANGVYNVKNVWVQDPAGNLTLLDAAALREMGVNTQVVVSDGTLVAPELSASVASRPRTEDADAAIVVTLSAKHWRAIGGNEIELTVAYDAMEGRFQGWQAGSEGAYVLTAETLEVGMAGLTTIRGAIDNQGDASDFLELRFTPQKGAGNFEFDLVDIKINGASALDKIDQSFVYRTQNALDGTALADTMPGTAGDDYLRGLGGDDVFKASNGVDTLVGGEGFDSAVYLGKRDAYSIVRQGADVVVTNLLDAGDVDRLQSVEQLSFSDQSVSYDTAGSAAQLFRLYQAAFDRAPDAAGLGYWLAMAANGLSLQQIATGFVASKEFNELHGKTPGNAGVINSFYLNTLDRPADADGARYWNDLLERKVVDVAHVLLGFSESLEFQALSAGLVGQGVSYIPYG